MLKPTELTQIWRWRNQGQTVRAYEKWIEAHARLGLRVHAPAVDRYSASSLPLALKLELVALEGSFLRAQHRPADSEAALDCLAALADRDSQPLPFSYYLQKGLNRLAAQQWSEALLFFVQGRAMAATDVEWLFAQVNTLICFEALEYPLDNSLLEFSERWSRARSEEDLVPVRSQFEALELRELGRKEDWLTLRSRFYSHPFEHWDDQVLYMMAWRMELPYLRTAFPRDEAVLLELERRLEFSAEMGTRAYRARTLRGFSDPREAFTSPNIDDVLERLYLWTWRWLESPERKQLTRLLELAKQVKDLLKGVSLTSVQWLHLENSFLWLTRFAPVQQTEAVTQSLALWRRSSGRNFGFISVENRFLYNLLFTPGTIDFSVFDKFPQAMSLLANALVLESSEVKPIVADLRRFEIRVRADGRTFVSKNLPLLSLMACFEGRDVVAKSELLEACYGISDFDFLTHGPKLSNLLSYANKVFKGAVELSQKSDLVFMTGAGSVGFHACTQHALNWLTLTRHLEILVQSPASGTEEASPRLPQRDCAHDVSLFLHSGEKVRQDLEGLLKVSRATANRLIRKWEAEKFLRASGLGKSRRYSVNPKLKKEFAKQLCKLMETRE